MRTSGIVLEVSGGVAIVLTRDGEFCRVPAPAGVSVGAELHWEASPDRHTVPESASRPVPSGGNSLGKWSPPPVTGLRTRRRVLSRVVRSALGLVAGLVIAAGLWQGWTALNPAVARAYAFVSLDINPGVKLAVDRHLTVVSAEAEDADGSRLLEGLRLRGRPLREAVQGIVNQAAAQNMIPAGDSILVAAAAGNPGADVALVQREAQADVQLALQANQAARKLRPAVYSFRLSRRAWQAADAAHISPARFAVYVVAREKGVRVTLTQMHGSTVRNVLGAPGAAGADVDLTALTDDQTVRTLVEQATGRSGADSDGSGNTGSQPGSAGKDHAGQAPAGRVRQAGQGSGGRGSTKQVSPARGSTKRVASTPAAAAAAGPAALPPGPREGNGRQGIPDHGQRRGGRGPGSALGGRTTTNTHVHTGAGANASDPSKKDKGSGRGSSSAPGQAQGKAKAKDKARAKDKAQAKRKAKAKDAVTALRPQPPRMLSGEGAQAPGNGQSQASRQHHRQHGRESANGRGQQPWQGKPGYGHQRGAGSRDAAGGAVQYGADLGRGGGGR
ncbi:MAG: anti-sigma factor domain-containing protein [Alicyclobacillaceae bacterium]|nr:anti-sigma factor domain-containing protein [Alicyclobacillaceae bacterium]